MLVDKLLKILKHDLTWENNSKTTLKELTKELIEKYEELDELFHKII